MHIHTCQYNAVTQMYAYVLTRFLLDFITSFRLTHKSIDKNNELTKQTYYQTTKLHT